MKKILILFFFVFSCFNKPLLSIDFGSYLAGDSEYVNKDNKAAIYHFNKALNLNEINTEYGRDIAEKLCSLYLLEGKIEECVLLAERIERDLESESIDSTNIRMALVVSDIKKKKYNSALNRLKKIKKSSYERFSVPIIEAWLIAEEKNNFNLAEQKLNELEADIVVSGLRNLNLALIHDYFDKNQEALKFYQKSVNAFNKPSYRLVEITANAFQRNKDFEKAKNIFDKFLSDSNDYLLVKKHLNQIEKREIPKKLILDLNDAVAELFSTIASTFSSDFTNNFSIIYSNFSIYLKKDFEVAELYLAELLEDNNRYEEANNLYKKVQPSSSFFWHSKLKTARNLELLGDTDNAISILKKMNNEEKGRYDSLKLLGDIYRNYEKYDEAIKSYNEGINRIDNIEIRHWDLLYSRGMAYERDNQWKLAEEDFLKILELVPDQPDVLNYLGYSWIEKNINLEKAKTFILKAVELRPRDPYIVDSLGWAYYNLQEYDNAVEELERAISLKPTDPIINDHLGDAYLKVNRELEAIYQWKKAIEFKADDKLKKKIKKKLKKYNNNDLDIL